MRFTPLSRCFLNRQPSSPATTTGIESTTVARCSTTIASNESTTVDITESTTSPESTPPSASNPPPNPPPLAPNPPLSHSSSSPPAPNPPSLTLLPLPSHPCRFVKNRSGSTVSRLNRGLCRFSPVQYTHRVKGVDRTISPAGRRFNRSNRPVRSGFKNIALKYSSS
ncbi:hypothetical protein Acr_08g0011850 [Actinidia rufa]|uniref:Uncharacterized protein n=1 Tax=Actinidia rufa TaxID=165716 RepID=A0A7J0F3H7_9ERIC|nr:hypothetical protein Acr_08g0011850 [Actinidia rufa]